MSAFQAGKRWAAVYRSRFAHENLLNARGRRSRRPRCAASSLAAQLEPTYLSHDIPMASPMGFQNIVDVRAVGLCIGERAICLLGRPLHTPRIAGASAGISIRVVESVFGSPT